MIALRLEKIMRMNVQTSWQECRKSLRCQRRIRLRIALSLQQRLKEAGNLLNLETGLRSPQRRKTPSIPLLPLLRIFKRSQQHHQKILQRRNLSLKWPVATILASHYANHGPE